MGDVGCCSWGGCVGGDGFEDIGGSCGYDEDVNIWGFGWRFG